MSCQTVGGVGFVAVLRLRFCASDTMAFVADRLRFPPFIKIMGQVTAVLHFKNVRSTFKVAAGKSKDP